MFPRHDTMHLGSRPSAARRGLIVCNRPYRHSLIWSCALCLLLAATLVGAEAPAVPAAGGGGMAAPVATSEVFTNANQLKLKGAIAAVNFYYGGAGNADNAVQVTGPIQGVAFDNIDVSKCKPTTGKWGKDKATTVELAGGVKLTVDLLNGMWLNLNPGFGLSMDWVNRPLPKWSHESVARTITGDGNDGKHAGELATANIVFEAGKTGGLLTFALGNRFASKDVSVQVIAGGPWGGSVSVTDGTRTIGTIGDGDGTTAKILTFAAKADKEGEVSVGFTGKKNYLGIAGVIVSAAEASAAASATAASIPSANTTAAGKERPRKIYAMYMGCFPAGRGGAWWISHNVLPEMGAPRSIWTDNKGQEIKPPYQNLGAWATRSGGLGPYGKSTNIGLTPYDGKAPSPEESADREIRQAMRIGIDGFSIESSSGGFSEKVRPLIDLMFNICEEKNYPFEITITVCQNGEELTSSDLMPYKGNACVKTVKWLLDKHGNSPKLARRDGKPLILGYATPQYVEWSYWHPYVEKAARKNLGPDAKPEAVHAEVARLHNWPKWKSGDPTAEEAWKGMWLAFQDMEKEIGQPCYWEMDTNYVGPQDPNMIRILAQDFQAFGGFLSLHYFPLTADAAKIVVAAGKEWSQPIQLQYKNNASRGLDWLRRDWKAARELPSTLLQYITWNDYGETALAPGTNTRYAYYDVTGEFIRWWKTGKEPTSDHDKVYIFSHKFAPNTKIYPFKGGVAHFDHVIEVLTILPKPATLRMPGRKTTEGEGEWTVPAGMSYKQFPLTPGPVSVELLRDGKVELKLDCPDPVSDRPFRYDGEKTAVSTEELRHWQEDFGKDVPMYQYSEYGDVNNNGLPNWFEMFWFGKLGDMSTATNCPDPNAMAPSGKTLLECYREQIDPTQKIPSYADLPKTGLLAWYRADQGVEADASGKIGKWLDQSGNGLHLTPAGTNDAQKPSLVKNAWNGLPAVALDGLGNKMLCPLPERSQFSDPLDTLAVEGNELQQPEPKGHESMSVIAVFAAHAKEQVCQVYGNGRINRLISIPATSGMDNNTGLLLAPCSIECPNGDVGVASRKFFPGQQPAFIGLGDMIGNNGGFSNQWTFKGQVAEILIYSPALSEAETYTVVSALKARYKL